MRVPLLLFILTATTLAGCLGDSESTDSATDEDASPVLPQLHGWVFDPAVAPLTGVEVKANAGNVSLTTVTDPDGFYGFDELPAGTTVVLTARADGFTSESRQSTLAPGATVQMNFTLRPEPVIEPYHDTENFNGFIACQYRFELSEERFDNECGPGNNDNQWQLTVGKDFAGGVVEIDWTENTAGSRNLHAIIECATPGKCGDDTPVIAENIGISRLRLEISNAMASKYYPDGGIMLMTVFVDPNNDDQETNAGAAFAVSQEFQAIASLFYHVPPPSGYSVEG